MICPQCAAEGKKSNVYVDGSRRTLMGWTPFYDQDGVYHEHDPNVQTTLYRCSNGHIWEAKSLRPCPAPGCGAGATPEDK